MDHKQQVVVVWDSAGRFFQVWTSDYKGDGIAYGQWIAKRIEGSYEVLGTNKWPL